MHYCINNVKITQMSYFSKEAFARRQEEEVENLWNQSGEQVLSDRIAIAAQRVKELQVLAMADSSDLIMHSQCLEETRQILSRFDEVNRMNILRISFSKGNTSKARIIGEHIADGRYRRMTIWDMEPNKKGITN